MAITIITTPKDYAPVYNEMVLTALSDNIANDNYTYLVDIYVGGSQVTRLRIPPEPNNSYLVVDVHRVLEAYVNSDMFKELELTGQYICGNSFVEYDLKIGESYNDGTGLLVENVDVAVFTNGALNSSLPYLDFVDYDSTAYDMSNGNNAKFLTNSPNNELTTLNDLGCLYFLDSSKTDATQFRVYVYDSSNTFVGDYKVNVNNKDLVGRIASNPLSLNNIDPTNITAYTRALPIIQDGDLRYLIRLAKGGGVFISEDKHFYLDNQCNGESLRLIFFNSLGGFDSFNFKGRFNSEHKIKRKSYKATPNRLASDGTYNYSKSDRSKIQYFTKSNETIKVNSDWISEEQDKWLLELIESPEIYMQVGAELISVAKINKSSHKIRKHISEKLFMLEIEIELGTDNYRQRG